MDTSIADAVRQDMASMSRFLTRERFKALRSAEWMLRAFAAVVLLLGVGQTLGMAVWTWQSFVSWKQAGLVLGASLLALVLSTSYALILRACSQAITVLLEIEKHTHDIAQSLAAATSSPPLPPAQARPQRAV